MGQVFSIPFLLTTTEVMHKIRNYPFKLFPKNSFLPGEGMKYDSEVILEALHNCIAHQNYAEDARIIVIERENDWNSGTAVDSTMAYTRTMLPMPDYDKSDGDTVVLTLPGNVIDENYSLLLLENSDIDLTTAVLLDSLKDHNSLTKQEIVNLL